MDTTVYFILTDLIALIMFGEAYKLCSLLQPYPTSFTSAPCSQTHSIYALPQCGRPSFTQMQCNR